MTIDLIYVAELWYNFLRWLYLNKLSQQCRSFVLGIFMWWVMFTERERKLFGLLVPRLLVCQLVCYLLAKVICSYLSAC